MNKSFIVQKIKNVDWGSTRALVNISIINPVGVEILTIRDCKLIQGDFGSFVASPSLKVNKPYENKSTGKMVEYTDVIFFNKDIREELNNMVSMAYDPNAELGKWYNEGGTGVMIEVDHQDLNKLAEGLESQGIPS